MSAALAAVILAVVWVVASLGSGAALAFLARRIHPGLSFRRLWVFYSALMAAITAVVLAVGWF